ncbi:MAG: hypothetical protein GXO47_04650 [Chlorobi bacterium]|nr:hypothetical protein [Chlorobiota bacterium]
MQNIILGTGLENIKFGITPDELEKTLGKPSEYETSEEDGMAILHYDEHNLSFGFSKDYDNKLLSITTGAPEARIEDVQLIGDTLQEVLDKLDVLGINDVDIEDISTEEYPEQQLMSVFEYSLNLWFDSDELSEIQWGPFWNNEKDEPVWPE